MESLFKIASRWCHPGWISLKNVCCMTGVQTRKEDPKHCFQFTLPPCSCTASSHWFIWTLDGPSWAGTYRFTCSGSFLSCNTTLHCSSRNLKCFVIISCSYSPSGQSGATHSRIPRGRLESGQRSNSTYSRYELCQKRKCQFLQKFNIAGSGFQTGYRPIKWKHFLSGRQGRPLSWKRREAQKGKDQKGPKSPGSKSKRGRAQNEFHQLQPGRRHLLLLPQYDLQQLHPDKLQLHPLLLNLTSSPGRNCPTCPPVKGLPKGGQSRTQGGWMVRTTTLAFLSPLVKLEWTSQCTTRMTCHRQDSLAAREWTEVSTRTQKPDARCTTCVSPTPVAAMSGSLSSAPTAPSSARRLSPVACGTPSTAGTAQCRCSPSWTMPSRRKETSSPLDSKPQTPTRTSPGEIGTKIQVVFRPSSFVPSIVQGHCQHPRQLLNMMHVFDLQ